MSNAAQERLQAVESAQAQAQELGAPAAPPTEEATGATAVVNRSLEAAKTQINQVINI